MMRTASVGTLLLLAACGADPLPPASPSPTPSPSPSPPGSSSAASPSPPPRAVAPDAPAAIFARTERDLGVCFEQGRTKVPEMVSGRATIDIAVDAAGKAACVVVSDGTGLTQDVEDCFSARMSREPFAATGAPWSVELAVDVKQRKLALGPPPTAAPAIDMVETHGLPESAYDVIDTLLPALRKCTQNVETAPGMHVMHVGARIGSDGRVVCALASSASALPASLRDCSASVFAGARFPPPRAPSGFGILSVPVQISVSKR